MPKKIKELALRNTDLTSFDKRWWSLCSKYFLSCKDHTFWEGHKIFAKSSSKFWVQYIQSKVRWRFRKILWPSQNIWTLPWKNMYVFSGCTRKNNLERYLLSECSWLDSTRLVKIYSQYVLHLAGPALFSNF